MARSTNRSNAKEALRDIEREDFQLGGRGHGHDDPRGALRWFLHELHDILMVILEAAELPRARASLVTAWRKFEKEGLDHTISNPEYYSCESPALTFLERLIEGLRITVSDAISSEEAWAVNRLEVMLRDTVGLVHRREKTPANEHDVQTIMHDYLGASFSDFTPTVTISGSLKSFKPDCGIRNVGAAIEFKFVRTREEVATAFSGIAEDTAGYKGSKDWTRFYSVIYQAQPFALESHFSSDLKRIEAVTWKAFVVNGPTKVKTRRAKRSRLKKPG